MHQPSPHRTVRPLRTLLGVAAALALMAAASCSSIPGFYDVSVISVTASSPGQLTVKFWAGLNFVTAKVMVDGTVVADGPLGQPIAIEETKHKGKWALDVPADTAVPHVIIVEARAARGWTSTGKSEYKPEFPDAPKLGGLAVTPSTVAPGEAYTISGSALDADAPGGAAGYWALRPSMPSSPPGPGEAIGTFTASPGGQFSVTTSTATVGTHKVCVVVPDVGPGGREPAWSCVLLVVGSASPSPCAVADGAGSPEAVLPEHC